MDAAGYFRERRQGDIVSLEASDSGDPVDYAIVSQSCDVVLPSRENVLIAPLVYLSDPGTRRSALKRENPRYLSLQLDEKERFVDLNNINARSKESVSGASVRPGIDPSDDKQVRDFALAVGRSFSRFAFPDDVQRWLEPLQSHIREKYDSPGSPLGRVLHQVAEIRIEADSWSTQPCSLTLHLIVMSSSLPLLLEDDEERPDLDGATRHPESRSLVKIAEDILASGGERAVLSYWDELAWALADSCTPRSKFHGDDAVMDAVLGVEAMVWSDDEFSVSRYRKSEQLDIDFLSDPSPL